MIVIRSMRALVRCEKPWERHYLFLEIELRLWKLAMNGKGGWCEPGVTSWRRKRLGPREPPKRALLVESFPAVPIHDQQRFAMESHKIEIGVPNDKSSVAMAPTGSAGEKIFLDKLLPEEVRALKQLRTEEPELCADVSDAFLMKFIWARKLDVSRAKEVLRDHMEWRREWDLEHLDLNAIQAYLHSGLSYWAPGLYNRQGYSATFIVPRNLDVTLWKKLGSRGMMHAVYYITDLASDHDVDIARHGTVMVLDFAGASWGNILTAMKGEEDFDLSRLIDSAQNHMPSRVRDVILLNPPWWIRLLLGIVKPLLKSSLRRKIHSCKSSELGSYFTPDHIPSEWGGARKFDIHQWADWALHERPELSEGKYIDASTRSDELVRNYSGSQTLGTTHGTAAISRSVSAPERLQAQ